MFSFVLEQDLIWGLHKIHKQLPKEAMKDVEVLFLDVFANFLETIYFPGRVGH